MKPFPLILTCVVFLASPVALAEQLLAHIYPIENVRDIRVGGGASVELRQGASESLRAEAVKDVLDRVSVDLSGERLTLGVKSERGGFFNWINNHNDKVKFIIEVKDLSRLELSGGSFARIGDLKVGDLGLFLNGSGRAEIGRLDSGELKVDLSGAGRLSIAGFQGKSVAAGISGASHMEINGGAAHTLRVDASGASKYYSRNFAAVTARAHASGASHIEVRASESLDAHASGASHIGYYGNPSIRQHSSGASRVSSQGE